MFYLDTCILISYIFESDRRHQDIIKEVNNFTNQGTLHISPLTLLELYMVALVRLIHNKWKLPGPLRNIAKHYPLQDLRKILFGILIGYLTQSINIQIHGDNEVEDLVRKFQEYAKLKISNCQVDVLKIYDYILSLVKQGLIIQYADMLHILYAHELSKKKYVKYFVTSDTIFEKYSDLILNLLGLNLKII